MTSLVTAKYDSAKNQILDPNSGGTPATWTDASGTALNTPAGGTIKVGTSSGLPSYLGQVATRCFYNTRLDAGYTQAMLRTFHFARDDISSMQLRWDDKYSGTEAPTGQATQIQCAVEYPSGTYTRVTFGGNIQGSMASNGSLISDATAVSIPNGAKFWLRTYRTNPAGLISGDYCYLNTLYGEAANVGASIANQVMGGAIATTGFFVSTPTAILAQTQKPSILFVGDSRVVGILDPQVTNQTGDAGEFARSIGGNFGYINTAQSGATGNTFTSNNAFRTSLLPYVSHVFSNFGINDLNGAANLATMQTMYGFLWPQLGAPTKPVYQATLPPFTTSTDSWATVANQTVATWDSVRVATNAWIRTQGASLAGVLDITRAVESSTDSGKWLPNYVGPSDGIHENITGAYAIVSAAAINPVLLTRRV